jgi:hypothetical protein
MEKPVPKLRRSRAVMARPSNWNSSNILARQAAVISGKKGFNARTASWIKARELSFNTKQADKYSP